MKKQFSKFMSLFLVLALALTLVVPTTSVQAKAKKKKLTISKATVTLDVKKTAKLKVKYGSKNVTTNKKTKWKSSNKKVATVSKGKITAKAAGTATISAKYSGKTVKCKVTVKAKAKTAPSNPSNPSNPSDPGSGGGTTTYKLPSSITITPAMDTTIQAGQTVQFTAQVWPSGAKQAVTWRSSDTSVATVDSKGKATGLKKGTVYIYADSVDDNEWGKKVSTSRKLIVTPGAVVEDFNFARDCTVETGNKNVHVEFKINTEQTSVQEMKDLGYDVVNGVASADVDCATATYTFTNLPKTLSGIKQIPLDNYFGPIVASICAIATYDQDAYTSVTEVKNWGDTPSLPTVLQAFEYINGEGTSSGCNISNSERQEILGTLNSNFGYNTNQVHGGPHMYFQGATKSKFYKTNAPFVLSLYHGPYAVPAKSGEPEKQMIFVVFESVNDDENQRYIDTYHTSGGTWFAWGIQPKHLIASMKLAESNPWD